MSQNAMNIVKVYQECSFMAAQVQRDVTLTKGLCEALYSYNHAEDSETLGVGHLQPSSRGRSNSK